MKKNLDQRSLEILKKLIERYVRDGQPVASRALMQDSSLALSSATIRNIMADLEEAGFLRSPHTSAGRVPTTQGYRLFVDNFITVQPLAHETVENLRQQLVTDFDAQVMISRASSLLSDITQLMGVITLPMREELLLKMIEFLPLSERRLLVILVFHDQTVQNRVISMDRTYTAAELEQAGNYLTHHFIGKDIVTARDSLLKMLRQDGHELEQMIKAIMEMADKTIDGSNEKNFVMTGEMNLFNAVDQANYSRLRLLFETFSQKRDVLQLLDQVVHTQGIKIFIGEESGHQVFDDYSVVASPYYAQGKVLGVLGVIGPTRMFYSKAVTAVDVTAKLLSQSLEFLE